MIEKPQCMTHFPVLYCLVVSLLLTRLWHLEVLWHKHHIHLSVTKLPLLLLGRLQLIFIFNRKPKLKTQIRLPRVQPGTRSVCEQQLCYSVYALVGLWLFYKMSLQMSLCHFFFFQTKRAMCSTHTEKRHISLQWSGKLSDDWWRLLHLPWQV